MGKYEEKARALFLQGYNCAQAVAGAFAEDMGMEQEQVLRLVSSMGGGMGRLREVCGAVSGMCLAAGALYGFSDPKDSAAKREHYARIQELAGAFREKNGAIVCRELLGLSEKSSQPTPEERTAAYYQKRPCLELVGDAAAILEQYLQAHPPENRGK